MIEIYKTSIVDNKLSKILEEEFLSEGYNFKDCWINLTNPSDKEVSFVNSITGVEDDTIKYALDDEERAKIENEEGHLMILVDIPIIEEEADYYSYSTIPLSTIIKGDIFITTCLKETAILRDFVKGRIKGFATYKKTRFLFQILNNIATKFLAYLKQIDKASQRIQHELHKSTRNKELIQMLDLENSLVYFSTSLSGNDSVITRLMNSKNLIKMYEEDNELLEEVATDTKQAIEMCTIYREILSGTMDAYASVISNNQNNVMKVLTSVTLLISIPTLVASFFGMNTGVPMEGKSWGFWVALGIAILISFVLFILLKKKKFL